MSRICPDCAVAMLNETVEGVAVNICGTCGGVWVHPEALAELISRDPIGLLELDRVEAHPQQQKFLGKAFRNCPDCSMSLQDYHYCYNSPVIIQVCSDCGGFWIEHGQLTAMQEFLDEARRPATKEEQDRLQLAKFALEHENYMIRQENLQRLFDTMRRFRPGWQGLILG